MHNGRAQFTCYNCGYTASSKGALTRHQRTHQEPSRAPSERAARLRQKAEELQAAAAAAEAAVHVARATENAARAEDRKRARNIRIAAMMTAREAKNKVDAVMDELESMMASIGFAAPAQPNVGMAQPNAGAQEVNPIDPQGHNGVGGRRTRRHGRKTLRRRKNKSRKSRN